MSFDGFPTKPSSGGGGSFVPPIVPPVPGNPGPDQYLQSDGTGVVNWAPKPTPGTAIPAGTGWVKQGPAGTFGSFPSVPAVQTSYSPSVPANWPVIPAEADTALNSLASQIVSLAGSIAGLTPRTWFVNGGSPGGGNGSFKSPFQTVGAALAVAASGDLILIAPGTYVENLTLPNLDNLTICGSGKNSTIIKAATGSTTPTIKWAPTTGTYTKLTLRDLTLANLENGTTGTGGETGQCLYLDGSGIAVGVQTSFLTQACILDSVVLDKGSSTGDGFYLRCVDKMFVRDGNGTTILGNVAGWSCSGMLVNPGYLLVESTIIGNGTTGFSLSYDDTTGQIRPIGGRQGVNLANTSTVYGSVTLAKAPLFGMAPDTVIFGDIVATSLATFTSPAHAPAIRIAGQVGSPAAPAAVTVTMPAITAPMVAAGAVPYVDLSDAVIWGSAAKVVTMQGTAGGAVRFAPMAHRARFEQLPEGSATVKVISGTATDFDIRRSYYRQSAIGAVAATDGTIDRDSHSFTATVSPGAPAISPPFPAGVSLTALAQPTTAASVGATVTSTTLTLLGAATVNAQVRRNA